METIQGVMIGLAVVGIIFFVVRNFILFTKEEELEVEEHEVKTDFIIIDKVFHGKIVECPIPPLMESDRHLLIKKSDLEYVRGFCICYYEIRETYFGIQMKFQMLTGEPVISHIMLK